MAERGCLQSLNLDVLLQILEILDEVSPKSLLNLMTTSKKLYALTKPVLYRKVCTHLKHPKIHRTGRLLDRIIEDETTCSYVRIIDIVPLSKYEKARLNGGQYWTKVTKLILRFVEKCVFLREVHWDSCEEIDNHLFKFLQNESPPVKVHLRDIGVPCSSLQKNFSFLKNWSFLGSLQVYIPQDETEEVLLQNLTEIICCCRNLRHLDIGFPRDYCEKYFCLCNQVSSNPEVEIHLESLTVLGGCTSVLERGILSQVLESGSLKRLRTNQSKAPSSSTYDSLISLTLHGKGEEYEDFDVLQERIQEFIYQCHSLKEFWLDTIVGCVSTQLLQHLGKTLVRLRLDRVDFEDPDCELYHCDEEDPDPPRIDLISRKEHIKDFESRFPHLRDLSFSLFYKHNLPFDLFHQMGVSLAYLKKLAFHIEKTGTTAETETAYLSTCQTVWNSMWSEMKASIYNRYHCDARPPLYRMRFSANFDFESGINFVLKSFVLQLAERDHEAELGIPTIMRQGSCHEKTFDDPWK